MYLKLREFENKLYRIFTESYKHCDLKLKCGGTVKKLKVLKVPF
jgi:hypothetical protein